MASQNGDETAAVLTPSQREYLENPAAYDKSESAERRMRARIRERARQSLRDFRLLADGLDARDRDRVFAVEPRGDGLLDLKQDVMKTIEFIYAGLGGEAGFREPLQFGVMNGELELGNVARPYDIAPLFRVDTIHRSDTREVAEAIEAGEWNRVWPSDLFEFIRLAKSGGAIDFDAIEDEIDLRDTVRERYRDDDEE